MKTYTQLREDIYLSGAGGFGMRVVNRDKRNTENMGKIHKDYSLHRYKKNDSFLITHDKTNKVVGKIHGNITGKKLEVSLLSVHPEHTKKRIGQSLAVAAYKHLHGKHGYTIHSDMNQSPGGASVWNTLRKDPETKRFVRAVRNGRDIGQASKIRTQQIWTSHNDSHREKAAKVGIRSSSTEGSTGRKIVGTTLVLKGKKKR